MCVLGSLCSVQSKLLPSMTPLEKAGIFHHGMCTSCPWITQFMTVVKWVQALGVEVG
jgi:hypothetical protein